MSASSQLLACSRLTCAILEMKLLVPLAKHLYLETIACLGISSTYRELTMKNKEALSDNVISIFTGKALSLNSNPIIRIAPELDGIEMLYGNDAAPHKLYSLKLICWALRQNGEVEGIVPWLNDVIPCPRINDPLNGHWEGYRNPKTGEVFYQAPEYKIIELQAAAKHYQNNTHNFISVQEIPDMIGTHAVLTDNHFKTLTLIEVLSWRLNEDGKISGMLVNHKNVKSTPVLPGDAALFDARKNKQFKYFFQHHMASKIKAQDPEAMAAIAMLMD
jgi:hypothetical protein